MRLVRSCSGGDDDEVLARRRVRWPGYFEDKEEVAEREKKKKGAQKERKREKEIWRLQRAAGVIWSRRSHAKIKKAARRPAAVALLRARDSSSFTFEDSYLGPLPNTLH